MKAKLIYRAAVRKSSKVQQPTVEERMAVGKALRETVPRAAHGHWRASPSRPDPLHILRRSDRGRLPALLPIRYGRMSQSPLAFFRGSAAVMAWDLSKTPVSGIRVQACGDCHVANFGGFASPERRLLFDINDFDETLRGPWEWDVKRLAASIVLGLREIGLGQERCKEAVLTMARSYRNRMHKYAEMSALNVWYSDVETDEFFKNARTRAEKKRWEKVEAAARQQNSEHFMPKIVDVRSGRMRIVDHPPLVYHSRDSCLVRRRVTKMFRRYRDTLPEERRILLDRYHIVDVARKVVGVGSVGTRCALAVLVADEGDPLLLQFKEALPSVLESYAGKSRYKNHGERVVTGQRMLQSASDVFLGWTHDEAGRDYYFRQLRDMRMKLDLSRMPREDWFEYVEICGWALARAQARTGDPAQIAGYLGTSDKFDGALVKFAVRYADQTERDYEALLKAIRSGKLRARKTATE